MKKIIVPLIVACVLIVFGGCLVIVYAGMHDWNFLYEGKNMRSETYAVQNEISAIDVDADFASVVVKRGGTAVTIEYSMSDAVVCDIVETNGVLCVHQTSKSKFFNGIFLFGVRASTITISLPEAYDGYTVKVTTSAGEIRLEQIGTVTSVFLKADAGSVSATDFAADVVVCETDAGAVSLRNGTAGSLSLNTDMGSVELNNVAVAKSVEVETDMGTVYFTDVSADSIKATASMGSVEGKRIAAPYLEFETDMGSVNCTIVGKKSEYNIFVERDMGSSNIQGQRGSTDRELTVKTSMGSINITFSEQ